MRERLNNDDTLPRVADTNNRVTLLCQALCFMHLSPIIKQTLGSVALISLLSFSPGSVASAQTRSKPEATDVVTAGNLYFYLNTTSVTREEFPDIVDRVVGKYEPAGIRFQSTRLLNSGEFPTLKGLDMLLLVLHKSDMSIFNYEAEGEWGIADYEVRVGMAMGPGKGTEWTTIKETAYTSIKEKIRFPYTPLEAQAHIGVVLAGDKMHGETCDEVPFTVETHHEHLATLLAHEVGHGLGASHLYYRGLIPSYDIPVCGSKYIMTMGFRLDTQDSVHHPRSVRAMKTFVKTVKDYDDQHLIDATNAVEPYITIPRPHKKTRL